MVTLKGGFLRKKMSVLFTKGPKNIPNATLHLANLFKKKQGCGIKERDHSGRCQIIPKPELRGFGGGFPY